MKVEKLKSLVGDGKFFSVEFVKKDGSLRKINARIGVTCHLKGGQKRYNAEDKNLLTVFDLYKKQYRTINATTIKSITVGGTTYHVS